MIKLAHGISIALGFVVACANGLCGVEGASENLCAIRADISPRAFGAISASEESRKSAPKALKKSAASALFAVGGGLISAERLLGFVQNFALPEASEFQRPDISVGSHRELSDVRACAAAFIFSRENPIRAPASAA